MIWRALFGIVPILVFTLFVTGAIPLSAVLPGSGSTASGERGQLGPVRNGRERAAEAVGQIYGVRPDAASLMAEDLRNAERDMDRYVEESKHRATGWKAKSDGWSR